MRACRSALPARSHFRQQSARRGYNRRGFAVAKTRLSKRPYMSEKIWPAEAVPVLQFRTIRLASDKISNLKGVSLGALTPSTPYKSRQIVRLKIALPCETTLHFDAGRQDRSRKREQNVVHSGTTLAQHWLFWCHSYLPICIVGQEQDRGKKCLPIKTP